METVADRVAREIPAALDVACNHLVHVVKSALSDAVVKATEAARDAEGRRARVEADAERAVAALRAEETALRASVAKLRTEEAALRNLVGRPA
jgi:hypothetical protein